MLNTVSTIPYYKVIDSIDRFIRKNSYTYFDWFIGLTDNAEKMLFEDHRLNREKDSWIYEEVPDESDAKRIQNYFLNMGCVGGIFNDHKTNKFIYVYKRSLKSNP